MPPTSSANPPNDLAKTYDGEASAPFKLSTSPFRKEAGDDHSRSDWSAIHSCGSVVDIILSPTLVFVPYNSAARPIFSQQHTIRRACMASLSGRPADSSAERRSRFRLSTTATQNPSGASTKCYSKHYRKGYSMQVPSRVIGAQAPRPRSEVEQRAWSWLAMRQ